MKLKVKKCVSKEHIDELNRYKQYLELPSDKYVKPTDDSDTYSVADDILATNKKNDDGDNKPNKLDEETEDGDIEENDDDSEENDDKSFDSTNKEDSEDNQDDDETVIKAEFYVYSQ